MNDFAPAALHLFIDLEKNGIAYCHWKGSRNLREGLTGKKDMDLLVDKQKAKQCQLILLNSGFKRVISQPWARFTGIEDWIGNDEHTGKLLHIHLYYQLLLGRRFVKEQWLPWEKIILDSAVRDCTFQVRVINPNLEIVLLAARLAVETSIVGLIIRRFFKRSLAGKLLEQVTYLAKITDKKEAIEYAATLLGLGEGEKVIKILYQQSLSGKDIFRLKSIIFKKLLLYRRYCCLTAVGLQYYYCVRILILKSFYKLFHVAYFKKKRLPAGGLVIAVIGCDGAGKTTVTKELEAWLSWKLDVERIYLGSGSFNSFWLKGKNNLAHFALKPKKQKPIFVHLWKAWLAYLHYKKLLHAKKSSLNGQIILTDRYPQNQFWGIYDGPSILPQNQGILRSWLWGYEVRKYEQMALLAPDVVIKLHISPLVAWERKPGHKPELLERKARITSGLTFPGSQVIDIDATLPRAAVLQEIKKNIWDYLN
jgi:thymidylate kinase